MNTAKLVKVLEGWSGQASLYELSEPVNHRGGMTSYVVASTILAFDWGGIETMVFPANEEGNVLNWGELNDAPRHTNNHADALAQMDITLEATG